MQKEQFGDFTYAGIPEYRCDGDTSGNSVASGHHIYFMFTFTRNVPMHLMGFKNSSYSYLKYFSYAEIFLQTRWLVQGLNSIIHVHFQYLHLLS